MVGGGGGGVVGEMSCKRLILKDGLFMKEEVVRDEGLQGRWF